ncbi:hypothetical protein MEG_01451 [Bartonella tamiae Th307]|uniref:Uncharacterized protein n=1 Tax=Bartonella tamiae Th239 TaxID=1094558 RepID=J0ZQY9_9HYPH|nr:hypothetical protein ME5_00430 [Bartonella tamiae Th239]EJF93237.1 hypothetical protein MEG_01451 [Bartonella tamiae Th307]
MIKEIKELDRILELSYIEACYLNDNILKETLYIALYRTKFLLNY